MPTFVRYIGIDYSGAQTPTASLNGLRVSLRAPTPARALPDDAARTGAFVLRSVRAAPRYRAPG